ncbi:unnamed protein product [Rhizophagus irregularis]|nr:unnamed protein product [Rhizophagus irregularis]
MSGQILDFKKFWTPYFSIILDIFQTFYRYTGQFPNSFGDKFQTFFFRRDTTSKISTDQYEIFRVKCVMKQPTMSNAASSNDVTDHNHQQDDALNINQQSTSNNVLPPQFHPQHINQNFSQ